MKRYHEMVCLLDLCAAISICWSDESKVFGCICYLFLFFVSIVSIDHELAQSKAFLCCRCLPNCDCDCSCQGRSGCGDCRDKHSTQKADFRRSLFKIIQSPFTLKFGKTLMGVSGHNSSTSRKGLEKMLRSSTTSNIQAFATGEHDLRRNCEPFLSFPSPEG